MYSVNIKLIDEQHKKLFAITNRLSELKKNGAKKEDILKIIKELEDYTVYHFGTEEKYFKKFNYAEEKEHIAMHQMFIKKIAEFKKAETKKDTVILQELLTFLKNWWIHHIQEEDMKYSDTFNQNGLY